MTKITNNIPVSVGFFSLGCAKNLVDTQVLAGALVTENISLAHSPEEADVVIVNTCSFIEDAREESVDTILTACQLKISGPCQAVIVAGCLPQRYPDEMKSNFPDVDAFIGLDELNNIGAIVREVLQSQDCISRISKTAKEIFEPQLPQLVLTGGPYAYLKIAEGCNHRCSFCAIPSIRGKYRSRNIQSIVQEAEQLLESGIKELNLISQDLTSYGNDLEEDIDLAALLKELGKIGGDFWIRLLYGYPTGINRKLLETMANTKQVCHYLDVPIQHSHPNVLRDMSRGSTAKLLHSMISTAREIMPDIALRTTCLVGFPGETNEQFKHMLTFINEIKYDQLGAFIYSPEDGTKAATLASRPSIKTAESRRDKLMLSQRKIVDEKNSLLVGKEASVLIESQHPTKKNVFIARSTKQAPEVDSEIIVKGAKKEDIGNFVNVRYSSIQDYDLLAKVIK